MNYKHASQYMACINCITDLLLAGVRDVSVFLEKRTDVECLPTPETAVDRPVECQLEGATVERP